MKKQIRKGVFETNSSSTHSLCVSDRSKIQLMDDVCIDTYEEYGDGYIHVTFGKFGWEVRDYAYWYDKLQYLLTIAFEIDKFDYTTKTYRFNGYDDFCKSDAFVKINEAVKEFTGHEIWLDSDIKQKSYEYQGEKHTYVDIDGYVDHQSYEDYYTFNDFLTSNGITNIGEFIFDMASYVHTDNDNY